jgi:hypothetical protein
VFSFHHIYFIFFFNKFNFVNDIIMDSNFVEVFFILLVLEVFLILLVAVGVTGNCIVYLDLIPLVLCVRISGGCWWVVVGCGFV